MGFVSTYRSILSSFIYIASHKRALVSYRPCLEEL